MRRSVCGAQSVNAMLSTMRLPSSWSPSTRTTPCARALLARPATAREPRERAAVHAERDRRRRRRRVEQHRAPLRRNLHRRQRSAASPRRRTPRCVSGGAPAFLPDDVGQALRRDAPERQVGDRTFEVSGRVDRLADVLVVVPAVEHADRHELPVRTRAFGREPFLVPLVLGERAHRVEPALR